MASGYKLQTAATPTDGINDALALPGAMQNWKICKCLVVARRCSSMWPQQHDDAAVALMCDDRVALRRQQNVCQRQLHQLGEPRVHLATIRPSCGVSIINYDPSNAWMRAADSTSVQKPVKCFRVIFNKLHFMH